MYAKILKWNKNHGPDGKFTSTAKPQTSVDKTQGLASAFGVTERHDVKPKSSGLAATLGLV